LQLVDRKQARKYQLVNRNTLKILDRKQDRKQDRKHLLVNRNTVKLLDRKQDRKHKLVDRKQDRKHPLWTGSRTGNTSLWRRNRTGNTSLWTGNIITLADYLYGRKFRRSQRSGCIMRRMPAHGAPLGRKVVKTRLGTSGPYKDVPKKKTQESKKKKLEMHAAGC
jgi:hypothetical protein